MFGLEHELKSFTSQREPQLALRRSQIRVHKADRYPLKHTPATASPYVCASPVPTHLYNNFTCIRILSPIEIIDGGDELVQP